MQPRATAQIARTSTRWLRNRLNFGYTRLFASAVPPTEQKKPEAVPPELGSAPSRPWQSSGTQAGSVTPTSTSPSSKFYVPSVVIPAEAAKSGPVHKIHILGEDVRSRFIAHALCSVYDSVETVPFREMPKSRYRNVEKVQRDRTRKNAFAEKNAAMPEDKNEPIHEVVPEPDRSHIDELIVTGRGFEAVKAIVSVKDRIDDKTSICLLNDGMGVLERVREEIFDGTQPEPNFYLGHMSHALVFNRNRDSVKQLKTGRTIFTKADPILNAQKELYTPAEQQPSLMHSLKRVKELNTTFSTYEHWLRFKLPSMMFTAAVEPVCVLLDLPYQGLMDNRSAQKMMNQLLAEMALVTENMPEVKDSPDLIKFLRGEGLKKFCYRRITGKSKAPSDLLQRINKGLQTDMNYQNGYFLKRAKILGIDTPTNQLMVQMIKARRAEQLAKLQSIIPVQEASPNDVRKKTQQRMLRNGFL
ncbi:ketopantoate reductase PanE/ApbA C terminal-domain-containing protein [Fusarium redolens]|uniref:Ketopantoate reductase PanE/ApbA C terminal-domain-containing protein n=1 Tax=Fusarium redolens TaxID=48865 RepID=A0A9P9KN44_FUSRE|nr:ketopantoate reductase PanE/ApbA C terminal-domain-containing protein [Fusarium redolens]KAH7264795.1 ketopantoate reductase PanE/ApbA C terminal-domain-containing protein [Fusarium redolens]